VVSPPPDLIGRVIEKVRSEEVKACLVVPAWTHSWWWLRLCPDGRHFGHWVRGYKSYVGRGTLVEGEGRLPMSMKQNCRILVLDLDGACHDSQGGCGPVADFCTLKGCADCNMKGSWL
jgi:hypothetical protein